MKAIKALAKNHGITCDEVPMDFCMGCIGKPKDTYRIVINSNLGEIDKRQTIAHELGHYLTDTVNAWNPRHEGMANKKARELLVPEHELREAMKDHEEYSILACLFGVSKRFIQLRCEDLSI